jgi:hypothetical protein
MELDVVASVHRYPLVSWTRPISMARTSPTVLFDEDATTFPMDSPTKCDG